MQNSWINRTHKIKLKEELKANIKITYFIINEYSKHTILNIKDFWVGLVTNLPKMFFVAEP